MNIQRKARNVFRALVQSYGSERAKRRQWDDEYASGRWNYLDEIGELSVRSTVEKYASNGSILDLGCGSAASSNELNPAAYSTYTGVDISDVAVEMARARAQEAGRADQNEYCQSDILMYEPTRRYDIILFGDSIYYVPFRRIATMLKRYSQYLTPEGVFIARLCDVSGTHRQIVETIESHSKIIEKHVGGEMKTCIIVFRPLSEKRASRFGQLREICPTA